MKEIEKCMKVSLNIFISVEKTERFYSVQVLKLLGPNSAYIKYMYTEMLTVKRKH